jgi:hypothetical protein
MILKGDTQESLAKALGIARPSLNIKINNKGVFKLSEINIISKRYDLTPDEVTEMFGLVGASNG